MKLFVLVFLSNPSVWNLRLFLWTLGLAKNLTPSDLFITKTRNRTTVIAEIFVRDLITYILYLFLPVRQLVAFENYARKPM